MIHPRTLQALEFPKIVDLFTTFCLTPQGRTQAMQLRPLASEQEALDALLLYEDGRVWRSDPEAAKLFTLSGLPDVAPLLSLISSRRSVTPDIDAFWALRSVLNQAKSAFAAITLPKGEEAWPRLFSLATSLEQPVQLTHALNRCISDDALFKDESSPELFRLRHELRSLHQNCLHKVHDFAAKYNILPYLQEEFMTISQDRYVLPLRATYKGRLQGILHDWSQTGETCYFEPMFLVELNNRLQELRREEHEEEMRLLLYLADLMQAELPLVENALALLTRLDLLNAKARLADLLNAETVYFVPFAEGLSLKNARHPLLVAQAGEEERRTGKVLHPVHPLEISLRPGDRCLLITGGNAGGKTVCLKTLGLLYAMAASGLPVPVSRGSHLFWLDRLDAFIGDEQDLEDHVSTFTAQIEHLSKAWKYLTAKSLVLLDEFGAGTDPTHGAALAQAVFDSLLERGAIVFAATHFPTLKIWALSTPAVRAASMLFDPESKRPLYRLAYDQVGQSQTLTVAREHGLPQEIIERAEKNLLLTGEDSSLLLERLNTLAVEREREISSFKSLQKKTEADAKNLKEKLKKEQERLRDEVKKNIQELMQAWKAGKAQAKQTLNLLRQEREKLEAKNQEEKVREPLDLTTLSLGSRVHHLGLNKNGEVTDIDTRKERVRLDLGGISLWADLRELESLPAAEVKKMRAQTALPRNADLGFTLSLDVRGQNAETARACVQRFLDKNILSGLSAVEIIHGRGTGVLRRELHQYLSGYPGIDHFELAPEDQGGDGKTIVHFS